MACRFRFPTVRNGPDACSKRVFDVEDIVVRLGVLAPDRVFIRNYPISNPVSIFNPSIVEEGNYLKLYARIVTSQHMYVSSIAELTIPWVDIIYGYISENKYIGNIVLYPSTKFDIWGVEDPRVQLIGNKLYMTYIGRVASLFNNIIRKNRTVPISAIYNSIGGIWVKKIIYNISTSLIDEVVSIKDAFIHKYGDQYYLFYRLHLIDDTYHVVYSSIDKSFFTEETNGLQNIALDKINCIVPISSFEYKIGFGTPPLFLDELGKHFITLLYSVDRENYIYRVFALELSIDDNELYIDAVTPRYIMEPRELYELIGGQPLTIYPSSLTRVDRDNLLIAYGACNSVVGFGLIDYNILMSELDRGRIY